MVDAIVSGFDYSKAFTIITDNEEVLRNAIVNDIKRGVTILDVKGGYTNKEKSMLLVVVRQKQEIHLKKLIKRVHNKQTILIGFWSDIISDAGWSNKSKKGKYCSNHAECLSSHVSLTSS